MKAVLDACVLFPSVMREMLLGASDAGLFTPVWSARILGEWVRASARLGPAAAAEAARAAARLEARFPAAECLLAPDLEARLQLPDPSDVHILATAIASSADAIVTLNAADFPRGVLAGEGLARRDPDGFLWELASHAPEVMAKVAAEVQRTAENHAGQAQPLRPLLKRARLPRLARFLDAV